MGCVSFIVLSTTNMGLPMDSQNVCSQWAGTRLLPDYPLPSSGSWHTPADTGDMLCSQQPLLLLFVSFLHVGICILFQVTHLALWGPGLLLVRQAHGKDKVCFHLNDVGMGPRWAWWMRINFNWLSCSNWDMQFSKDISVSLLKYLQRSSPITPYPQGKQDKTCTGSHLLQSKHKILSGESFTTSHDLSIPSLAEFCLLLMAIQKFTKFVLWAWIETIFSSNLAP